MHTHSIERWKHRHVFLGAAHERNERRVWAVVALTGAAMVAEIVAGGSFPNLSVDEILVTTAAELGLAAAHRQALTLPAADRAALLAYLRQLDATPEANPAHQRTVTRREAATVPPF